LNSSQEIACSKKYRIKGPKNHLKTLWSVPQHFRYLAGDPARFALRIKFIGELGDELSDKLFETIVPPAIFII
jgi:hypothetical protein